jgi:hypothetical protein
VVGVGQEPKFEDGVIALPLSLTSARTTPANDGVNIGGALRHVRFSTLGSSETQPLAARTEMQRRSIYPHGDSQCLHSCAS